MGSRETAPLYRIRPFAEADLAPLCALWERCGLTVAHNDPAQDITLFRASPNAEILLAERDGAVVGSACVGHDGHRGWLYYVGVDPALRRRGLAKHLVREAEAWLCERGLRKVQLMIRPTNQPVRDFYEALGYGHTPRLVMARWLEIDGPRPAQEMAELEAVVTYLEMTERPSLVPPPPPAGHKLALLRAETPTVAFYRFLYAQVGEPWLWWERRALDDEALATIIQDPKVAIYVLYIDGVPAGYAELDFRREAEAELAYFGLMPEFIGRGLGPYLLHAAIETAWDQHPGRLIVSTNSLDHAKALPLYQRFGFRPYGQERKRFPDPRGYGLLPPDAGSNRMHV